MANTVCFMHRDLDSSVAPELSCKVCCAIFMNGVRERRKKNQVANQTQQWVEKSRSLTSGLVSDELYNV